MVVRHRLTIYAIAIAFLLFSSYLRPREHYNNETPMKTPKIPQNRFFPAILILLKFPKIPKIPAVPTHPELSKFSEISEYSENCRNQGVPCPFKAQPL